LQSTLFPPRLVSERNHKIIERNKGTEKYQ